MRWVYAQTTGQRLRLLALTVANVAQALLSVGFALACKALVDGAVMGDRARLLHAAVGLLAVILAQIACGLLADTFTEQASVRLAVRMQEQLLGHILQSNYADVVSWHSGELMNRLFSDVGVVVGGVVSLLPSAAYLLFRLVGAVAVLAALAPWFTGLFLLVGVLVCGVMLLMRGRFKHLHKQMQEAGGRLRAYLQETLTGLLVIRVFGAENRVREQAMARQQDYCAARKKRWQINLLGSMGFQFIFQLGYFLAMAWGCFGIFNGAMTYGTLMAMLQLVNQIQGPFAGFSGLITRYYSALASAERLMELAQLPCDTAAAVAPAEAYESLQALCFDHVGFTYGRTPVLRDVCATLRKGETVSVAGLSGGGKSTLFLLLLGAYAPVEGAVYAQTATGERLPISQLRGLFAYVPQGNYLFSGTLRQNVTFLRRDVPETRVWEALRFSCAEAFVKELPQGLDTMLGEKGHGLSEGQMQRIAIARALLSDAPVLLLDEATSALDEATEAQLLRNIRQLTNRTCMVVTHRKAALAICQRHWTLQNGRLCESEMPSA